jgi:rhodanese-related sulfurtransferase
MAGLQTSHASQTRRGEIGRSQRLTILGVGSKEVLESASRIGGAGAQEESKVKPMREQASPGDYAGDIDAEEAWTVLRSSPSATLVDVRSKPEWTFVGVPDLSSLGKETVLVEWQTFPGMAANPDFLATLKKTLADRGVSSEDSILFLCRSGVRSRAAAIALSREGYKNCYNVAGGFEGDLDPERHRGRRGGWKASNLPWVQS